MYIETFQNSAFYVCLQTNSLTILHKSSGSVMSWSTYNKNNLDRWPNDWAIFF